MLFYIVVSVIAKLNKLLGSLQQKLTDIDLKIFEASKAGSEIILYFRRVVKNWTEVYFAHQPEILPTLRGYLLAFIQGILIHSLQ